MLANAQSPLDQVKADLKLTPGEVTMWIPDMPNVPPQDVPVMIAQTNQAQSGNTTTVRTFGICNPVPSNRYSAENGLDPIYSAQGFLNMYGSQTLTGPATTTILQQPTHGVLRLLTQADVGTILPSGGDPVDPAAALYLYLPDPNYVGQDIGTVQVDFGNGVKVNVKYFFQAVDHPLGNTGLMDACKKTGVYWKISSTLAPDGTSTITSVDYQTPATATASTPATNAATLTSILGTSLASSLDANTSGITLTIANLPNAAVGQTVGTAITLDTTAAGNGWYIDTTPALLKGPCFIKGAKLS